MTPGIENDDTDLQRRRLPCEPRRASMPSLAQRLCVSLPLLALLSHPIPSIPSIPSCPIPIPAAGRRPVDRNQFLRLIHCVVDRQSCAVPRFLFRVHHHREMPPHTHTRRLLHPSATCNVPTYRHSCTHTAEQLAEWPHTHTLAGALYPISNRRLRAGQTALWRISSFSVFGQRGCEFSFGAHRCSPSTHTATARSLPISLAETSPLPLVEASSESVAWLARQLAGCLVSPPLSGTERLRSSRRRRESRDARHSPPGKAAVADSAHTTYFGSYVTSMRRAPVAANPLLGKTSARPCALSRDGHVRCLS